MAALARVTAPGFECLLEQVFLEPLGVTTDVAAAAPAVVIQIVVCDPATQRRGFFGGEHWRFLPKPCA